MATKDITTLDDAVDGDLSFDDTRIVIKDDNGDLVDAGPRQFLQVVDADCVRGSFAVGEPGSAGSWKLKPKVVTAFSNNVAKAVITITVPNVKANAVITVRLMGVAGASGAVGEGESTAAITYDIAIARTPGVNATGNTSTGYGSRETHVTGGTTLSITGALSAVSGAVGASNSFTFDVTIARSGSTSDNHSCEVVWEIANRWADGVTVS